ncbi:MAG TPA: N-acetyl sugar amidotransferase [Planctomycetaceae bacterium]|nr:N-acetyl sugar amidotransferase [Planctomycetaceae bacterium]HRF01161.1 N-acetyl sugar amidotransferase [Pirellulaceae bacterium]
MKYCRRCVYPMRAVNTMFDREGVCSACRASEEMSKVADDAFWTRRREVFERLIDGYRRPDGSDYDCIVPVSGGKDSYWQAYLMKQYGMNPLLVTYHGNNYLPEGQGNLDRMRDVLGIDHMVFGPSVPTLRKLNRLGFTKMGDMNWHCHAGIKIVPLRVACRMNIPLMVWGEITWTVAGMFSPDDWVEYNKRTVMEHDLRGFGWEDMIGGDEGLTASDLTWLRFPSDDEIARVGVRGIYIGNFFRWDPNVHAKNMADKFSFEFARQPFERTYRTMSNLDDMHENGIHDYMKFVKFGYGRASDHSSKDVRDGYLTREQAIEMVRKYDHVKPRRDLERWLDYVGMSEAEFDAIADTFRNPRVWWIENGEWWKENVWGEPSSYGPVHPSPGLDQSRYVKEDRRVA